MAITALSIPTVDREEYSRYERHTPEGDRGTIVATIGGTASDGAVAYFALLNERNGRRVATKPGTFAANRATVTFDLEADCKDEDGIYRAVQGSYHVTVTDTDPRVTPLAWAFNSASRSFRIALVTATSFRQRYLGGIDLEIRGLLSPEVRGITGVVGSLARSVEWGGYPLAWDHTAHTLRYNRGPATVIDMGATTPKVYDLPNETLDGLIRVTIADPAGLPVADVAPAPQGPGYAWIDHATLDDDFLRSHLADATRLWGAYLDPVSIEPKQVSTEQLADKYPYADDPTWSSEPWEQPKSITRGPEVRLGGQRVIKVHSLYGYYNTTLVLTIDATWRVADDYNGLVIFVPAANAKYPASTAALGIFGGLIGPGYLADYVEDFWQFAFTFGMRDLHDGLGALIRAGIEHTAALNILGIAGRAWQGNLASESFSRDGLSLSKQYTSGQLGLYSDLLTMHQTWLTANQALIKHRVVGIVGIG